MSLRGIRLVVPASAVVELHPIVLSIFHLAGILEGLRQEITQVIVVRGILETKVAHIAQIFVEFFCDILVREMYSWRRAGETSDRVGAMVE
jgi:hypothetical protein